jgi:hypothetical protein
MPYYRLKRPRSIVVERFSLPSTWEVKEFVESVPHFQQRQGADVEKIQPFRLHIKWGDVQFRVPPLDRPVRAPKLSL